MEVLAVVVPQGRAFRARGARSYEKELPRVPVIGTADQFHEWFVAVYRELVAPDAA